MKTKLLEIIRKAEKLLKKRLNEQLVPASLKDLNFEMKNNSYLKNLLTTKAAYLPKAYSYLINEVYSDSDNICLYDLIEQSQAKLGEGKVFFSKLDDKIVGWAGYATDLLQKKLLRLRCFHFI